MAWLPLCVLSLVLVGVTASPRRAGTAAKYLRMLEDLGRYDVMHDECGFEEDERLECGKRTYQESECKVRGCCYRPCEGCDRDVPWCYLAKRMVTEECQVAYEDKDDCGYYGISEGECFMRECCWAPSGKPNDPPCFKKKYSSVRLVEGEQTDTTFSGRVEIHHDDVWGTVCDDNFDNNAAKVVCGSLGYEYSEPKGYATYGEGSGQIWLDGFTCSGDEEQLEDCPNPGWGQNDCSHSEDAGVFCSHEEIDQYVYYVEPYIYDGGDNNGSNEDDSNGDVSIETGGSNEDSSENDEYYYNWYRAGGRNKANGINGFKGKPQKRHLNKVWTKLTANKKRGSNQQEAKSAPTILSNVKRSGQPRSNVKRSGHPWSNVKRSGHPWSNVKRSGHPWSNGKRSGHPWSNVKRSGRQRSPQIKALMKSMKARQAKKEDEIWA